MNLRSELLARLVTMHAYMRPAGSAAEKAFIGRYLAPLGAVYDRHQNLHVITDPKSPVLWSCHTDTVARQSGSQRVKLAKDGTLTATQQLGADDTAGVFILAEMVRRGVPGHYVFHYGEEKGCIGSTGLANEFPDWLSDIKYAIALDRRGYTEVITHQIGERCASDVCGDALAAALVTRGMHYVKSDAGLYTDTACYRDIVPECFNLSVGYFGEHGSTERLDTDHVLDLLEALSVIDVTTLPCDRDPAVIDPADNAWAQYFNHRSTARWDRSYHDRAIVLRWPDEESSDIEIVKDEPCGYLNTWQCCECGRYNALNIDRCKDCQLSYDDHEALLSTYLRLGGEAARS